MRRLDACVLCDAADEHEMHTYRNSSYSERAAMFGWCKFLQKKWIRELEPGLYILQI